jgi:hypothetical protein
MSRKLQVRVETSRSVQEFERSINEHLDNLARTPYLCGPDPVEGWWGVVFYYEWVDLPAEGESEAADQDEPNGNTQGDGGVEDNREPE